MPPLCEVVHIAIKHADVISRQGKNRPREMRYALVRIGTSFTSVHIDVQAYDLCAASVPVVSYAEHRAVVDGSRRKDV
jgi:hypothetical protein